MASNIKINRDIRHATARPHSYSQIFLVCLPAHSLLHMYVAMNISLIFSKAWDGDAVEAFPELDIDNTIAQPIDMRMTPDGTKWWIVDMEGEIVEVSKSCPPFFL